MSSSIIFKFYFWLSSIFWLLLFYSLEIKFFYFSFSLSCSINNFDFLNLVKEGFFYKKISKKNLFLIRFDLKNYIFSV